MLKPIWQPAHPAHSALGLLLWCVWFVVLYATLSVTCSLAPPPPESGSVNWLNAGLLILTLATAATLLCWARRSWRASLEHQGITQARLITRVGAGVHLLSAGATLIVGFPAAVLPPCV